MKKLTIDRDFQAAAGRMLKDALEFRRQVEVAVEDEIAAGRIVWPGSPAHSPVPEYAENGDSANAASTPQVLDSATTSSMLILDDIDERDTRQGCVARIIGTGRFDGVDILIGPAQLLFVWMLSRSDRVLNHEGEQMTVVTKQDVTREFRKWIKTGCLEFNPTTDETPRQRVQKLWGKSMERLRENPRLKGIFADGLADESGEKVFALRLLPAQAQIRISDIGSILKREGARRRKHRG